MKLGTWILSLVEPIAARVFTSLGLSVVSIVGMQQFSVIRVPQP